MGNIKRSSYEIVIVVIVVVLTVVLGFGLYSARAKVQRAGILTNELSMIRSAITTFKIINKKNPATLEELIGSTYKVDDTQRTYLDHLPGWRDGKILDPFGNPYIYDSDRGWISSSTGDYSKW